ncbi:MAG TPA: hypothetical protein VIG64_03670 [Actinomycetota bacterium]|jgi:hypothetical protein
MRFLSTTIMVATIALAVPAAHAAEADTMLASAGRDGKSTGYKAEIGGISGEGRYVLFSSRSPDIVKGDTNGARDVFVWDRKTGKSVRANVSSDGSQTSHEKAYGHIGSTAAAISDDGSVVLFGGRGAGLTRSDSDASDAFVRDLRTGKTTLVSRGPDDTVGYPGALSANGRFVVYGLFASGEREIILFDRQTRERSSVELPVRQGQDYSQDVVAITNDGQSVTFVSNDPELQSDSVMPGGEQVYMLDVPTGDVEQVSVSSDEQGANNNSGGGRTSPDGRYVVFESTASNLAPGHVNRSQDVFLRDRVEGTTTVVTVGQAGLPADGPSWSRDVSDDGCRVALDSDASNLVEGDTNSLTDVFVRDLCAEGTSRVSVASDGAQGNGPSFAGFLSGDGEWAAFKSKAANLAAADPNPKYDVFARGPLE